jgi:hypothetical protein
VLAPGIVTVDDGSNTCPGSNPTSVDAVIRYTKTTPSASDGGSFLRVLVESHETISSAWMSVAVLRDECDPEVAGLGPARIRCVDDHNPQTLFLDVGPGDYYVWLSRFTGSDFRGANVRIEEVPAAPEGETCVAPYDTTTGDPIYTAPASPGGVHTWTLPPAAVVSVDHAVAYNGPGAMACDIDFGEPDGSIGADAVVRLSKTSSSSVGWLLVENAESHDVMAEVRDRCEPVDPIESAACGGPIRTPTSGDPRYLEAVLTGPAGPRYLWLASHKAYNDFPGAAVRYQEIEPGPGDTCATAIPLAVGVTTPVTADRPHRLPPPSCFARSESVTWYRFTTTTRFTHVTTDAPSSAAAVRALGGSEIECRTPIGGDTMKLFLPPATEVCFAVASGGALSSIRIDAFTYSGNLGNVTNLAIDRPLQPSGTPRPIIAGTWLAVSPTTLYMGIGSQGVLFAPRSGRTIADFRDDFTTQLGSDGISIGESLFGLDDAASGDRLHRLVDGSGAWSPVPWDSGSAYAAIRMDAIAYDGANLIYATDWSATQPTRFYSHSPAASGPATLLGSTNLVRNASGLAADASFFYVVAQTDATVATEGIYRISRADLAAPPVRLAALDVNNTRASIEIDDLASARYLYFVSLEGTVDVIADPGGASPLHLGSIARDLDSTNGPMTIDRASGAIYVFETTSASTGNFVRLE